MPSVDAHTVREHLENARQEAQRAAEGFKHSGNESATHLYLAFHSLSSAVERLMRSIEH